MKEHGRVDIGFHKGNILHYLSQHYSSPLSVIRECVQNAIDIDVCATNVLINIDQPSKIIQIFDDGFGADLEKITRKFEKVGKSLKVGDPEAMGEKGIGNLAGIAISKRYELLTRDSKHHGEPFRCYVLDRQVLDEEEDVYLTWDIWPSKVIKSDLYFKASTQVRLLGVNEYALKQLKNIDVIATYLAETFGQKIKNVKMQIFFTEKKGKTHAKEVKPTTFRGERQAPVSINTKFGKVIFDLFLSGKPVPNPVILITQKGYSIPIVNFFQHKQLDAETAGILTKGYFEGEIRTSFCKINPSREAFEWDEELAVFAEITRDFVVKTLKPIIDELESEEREDKYKKIAEAVIRKLKGFFKNDPSLIPDDFKSFIKTQKGVDDEESPGAQTTIAQDKRKSLKGKIKEHIERAKTAEPKKEPKAIQSKPGFGLQFYPPGPDDSRNWHSRTSAAGIIQINTIHKDFLDVERFGITKLMDYVTMLVFKEFTRANFPPPEAKIFDEGFEKTFITYWRANLT